MKIKLSGKCGQGKFTLIDSVDISLISDYLWYVDNRGYVYRGKSPKGTRVFLHQVIMGEYPQGKPQIDHINRNKLDNQRKNLKFCTSTENHLNKQKYEKNKSGYKGVYWHEQSKKWLARIFILKKPYYVGLFKTKEQANREVKKTEAKVKKAII